MPLTEPLRPTATSYPSAYPANLYGETPHAAMANQLTAMAMAQAAHDYVSVHTVVGESGQPMTVIKKNPTNLPVDGTSGRAYDATLFEVAAIKRLAGAGARATASAPSSSRTASPTPATPPTRATSSSS